MVPVISQLYEAVGSYRTSNWKNELQWIDLALTVPHQAPPIPSVSSSTQERKKTKFEREHPFSIGDSPVVYSTYKL